MVEVGGHVPFGHAATRLVANCYRSAEFFDRTVLRNNSCTKHTFAEGHNAQDFVLPVW